MTEQFTTALQNDAAAVVLDAPLLLESQWDLWCDEIWYIETADAIRLAAAAKRGWTPEALQQRTARQLHAAAKRRLSSRTINNHGTLEQLRSQISHSWQQLIQRDRRRGVTAHCRERLLGADRPLDSAQQ